MSHGYVPIKPLETRHLNPHQAKLREATGYENELAGAIEKAFAAGHWELPALVDALNAAGSKTPHNQAWTTSSYTTYMAEFESGYAK